MEDFLISRPVIQSTAGAVPVRNAKGNLYMEKVKVHRYVAGKRPDFAGGALSHSSSSDEEDREPNWSHGAQERSAPLLNKTLEEDDIAQLSDDFTEQEVDDPRLRRLRVVGGATGDSTAPMISGEEECTELGNAMNNLDRVELHRVLREETELKAGEGSVDPSKHKTTTTQATMLSEEESEDDDEILCRREKIRKRALERLHRQEAEEPVDADEDAASEMEENLLAMAYSSENEDLVSESDVDDEMSRGGAGGGRHHHHAGTAVARLKPMFVSKRDRITLIEQREREEQEEKDREAKQRQDTELRRKQTLKILNEEVRITQLARRNRPDSYGVVGKATDESDSISSRPITVNNATLRDSEGTVAVVSMEIAEHKRLETACAALLSSADDDDEAEYEEWKLRELNRIRLDRDERELRERERVEIDRIHQMTDRERELELKRHPKIITNQAKKGKYKFLQKYYHRGAFFVQDGEDEVYKRDFAQPTLDDHFDKTRLPKMMQVKNFGMAGRTKYTHLVDQDTSQLQESPWSLDTAQGIHFHNRRGGGMRLQFERPSARKNKNE